jgi:ABC-2 type transport system permease protein
MSPNKYVGYFAFITFLILNAFIWRPLNVATYLVRFGMRPSVTNSDFFGDAPFRAAWNWFTLYWLLFCGLLSIAAVLFWPRGKQSRWGERCARQAAFSRRVAAYSVGVSASVRGHRRMDRI